MQTLKEMLENKGIQVKNELETEIICICPFHNDHRPSMNVNKIYGYFHCFSCGACGKVSDLIGVNFIPSLQPKEKVIEITSVNLMDYFRGRVVESFRKERGFTKEIMRKFEVLEDKEGFLIFPIRNESGELKGVVKRKNRYFRTYCKVGKFLYGENLLEAKEAILVEGIADVMRSYQYGYPALGLFGCGITPEREQFISRRLRKVVLALDTDLSGRRASWKIYERIKNKLDIFVVKFPDIRKDIGELTKEEMNEMIKNKQSFTKARVESLLKGKNE